jgi:ParB-like chromosome segregation protein Spo0J
MKIVDRIEQWPLDKLIPYAKNSRTHSEEQIAQIAGSIKAFGFTNPILVGGDGVIVAGHGRLSAARQLGLKKVPVIVLDHLSETERRALVIADNKLALNAGWDDELLRVELEELSNLDFKMDLLGFDLDELERALGLDVEQKPAPDEFKDVDEQSLAHKCPRCGFEFDE